jgi:Rha family phage regulatory protein
MKTETALVEAKDGQAITTSLMVASVFGMKHKNVLQAIRQLDIPADFAGLNFQPGTYQDKNKQNRPMAIMTRDGFTLLAMGFTGAKAMQFKVQYIQAFNAMETELKRRELSQTNLARAIVGELRRQQEEISQLSILRHFAPNFDEMGRPSKATGRAKICFRSGYFTSAPKARRISVLTDSRQPMLPGIMSAVEQLAAAAGGQSVTVQIGGR